VAQVVGEESCIEGGKAKATGCARLYGGQDV
jgi:hypothetical protein